MKIDLSKLEVKSFITNPKKKEIKAGVCSLGSGCNFTLPHCSQVRDLCF